MCNCFVSVKVPRIETYGRSAALCFARRHTTKILAKILAKILCKFYANFKAHFKATCIHTSIIIAIMMLASMRTCIMIYIVV